MTVHLFITRHGKSIHNDPANERVWQYANDDVLGLTLQGIDQVHEKSVTLTRDWLHRETFTTIAHSGAVRALQTASLMRQTLKTCEYNVNPKTFACENRAPIMREFPADFEGKGWSEEFSFTKFQSDPRYNANGWCESFVQRVDTCRKYLKSSDLLQYFHSTHGQQTPLDQDSQVVLVGHHYALCALLSAIVIQREASVAKATLNWEWNAVYERITEAGHKYYLEHDHVLYLTPLLTGTVTEPYYEQWLNTRRTLEDKGTFYLKGLVKEI